MWRYPSICHKLFRLASSLHITDKSPATAEKATAWGRSKAVLPPSAQRRGYTFKVGETPIATRIKFLREVEVENRFQGTAALYRSPFPLWVKSIPAPPPPPIGARF
jgi:hypothetical protein